MLNLHLLLFLDVHLVFESRAREARAAAFLAMKGSTNFCFGMHILLQFMGAGLCSTHFSLLLTSFQAPTTLCMSDEGSLVTGQEERLSPASTRTSSLGAI